jgi:hypothetical protein
VSAGDPIANSAEALFEAAARAERPTASALARAARELTEHTPPKFLVGVSTVLRQAAQFAKGAEQAAHDFRYAYWRKTLHPDSWISDLLLAKKAKALRDVLSEAANKAEKPLGDQIRQEIVNIETVMKWLPARGTPGFNPAPVTKLGKLEAGLYSGALHGDPAFDPLRRSLARWQDAASGFDQAELTAAKDDLCAKLGMLSTKKSSTSALGRSSEYVKAVQQATKALSKQLPDQDALGMLARLGDAVAELLRKQRAAGIRGRTLYWRHLAPAIEASPNAWGRLGRKLASLEAVNAADEEAVKGLVQRIRAALAEAVGTASPAYQAAMGRSLRRAESLAATLNTAAIREGAQPAWRAVKPQAALFAPGVSGKVGKLFVDDAVLVVNEAVSPPRAFVLFVGQVKAGDASSRNAIAQLIEDQTRLFQGSLTIAGREFAMVPPTDLAWVQRAFVGTTRPSGASNLTGLVEHIDAPLDATALDDLALAWLRKAGKVL